MVQATPDSILGNRLRRLFVVFLVSHFVVFIQVWLTIEYLRISQELKKLNEGRGDGRLESSAKFFLIAGILTICSLLIFIVILFIIIISFFGGIFQVNLEIFFVNSLSLLLIALIIPMVLDALQMCSLYLAWVPLGNYFGSYQGFNTRFGGVPSTNRILTGIIRSFVAEILEIIGYTLLVYEIITLLAVPTNATFEMSLQFIFIGFVLLVIGGVIGTIGFANQSIGLYNTARVLQGKYNTPAKIQYQHEEVRNAPGDAMRAPQKVLQMNYCFSCGKQLPSIPDFLFCPNCGTRIN